MTATSQTDWHTTPQTIALFGRAYEACGDGNSDFPYDIEAELNDLGGEDAWMNAWDAYVEQRDAVAQRLAA
ncbi:MAG: hypothetical protein V4657_03880 [Pseudomonadota bacterium]